MIYQACIWVNTLTNDEATDMSPVGPQDANQLQAANYFTPALDR